jgi:hypothetical protein
MKPVFKFSALLLAVLFSFSFSQAQSTLKPKIGIEVEIGHKPHPDCPGFGLCKVKITLDLKPSSAGTTVTGNFEYDSQAGSIQWTQSRSQLMDRNFSKVGYFDSGAVTFESDEVLPVEVSQALGIKGTVTIKAGTYKAGLSGDVYTVYLTGLQISR